MADDRLIAMAVLAPGWEKDYDGRPPVVPVACLARIANCQALADGRFNIMVLGLRRIELARELPPKHLFREARASVMTDEYPPADAAGRPGLQRDLVEAFRKVLPALVSSREQLQELLVGEIPLGMLTDIIGYTLDLELSFKQQLLAEPSVDRRAQLLLAHLGSTPLGPARAVFPPDFSAN
jgi:Lon protease-like protein